MSLTIAGPDSTPTVTFTPIPGTLTYGGDNEDRGGGNIPNARAGIAKSGSCQVLVDSASGPTEAALIAIRSDAGVGDRVVSGDAASADALVDVSIEGDAVQIATVSWKGTTAST
jgi:hypothetical protein